MPSLDYIYDLSEKLEAENMDYMILALREGKKSDKVDVFLNIKKTSSKKAILTVLEELAIDIKSQLRDDTDLGGPDLPNDDEPF